MKNFLIVLVLLAIGGYFIWQENNRAVELIIPQGSYAESVGKIIVVVAESHPQKITLHSLTERFTTHVKPLPFQYSSKQILAEDKTWLAEFTLNGIPRNGIYLDELIPKTHMNRSDILNKEGADKHFRRFFKHGETTIKIYKVLSVDEGKGDGSILAPCAFIDCRGSIHVMPPQILRIRF